MAVIIGLVAAASDDDAVAQVPTDATSGFETVPPGERVDVGALSPTQERAAAAASIYLSRTPASHPMVIDFLTGGFGGEPFSEHDATAGLDSLGVDWAQQARRKGQNFLDIGTYSRSQLVRQLTSDSNGFGLGEANAGVDALDADWNTEAVEAATSYRAVAGSVTCDQMVKYLTRELGSAFTRDQAEFAAGAVGVC